MSNRIIGQSEALLGVLEEARQIASTNYSVIIQERVVPVKTDCQIYS